MLNRYPIEFFKEFIILARDNKAPKEIGYALAEKFSWYHYTKGSHRQINIWLAQYCPEQVKPEQQKQYTDFYNFFLDSGLSRQDFLKLYPSKKYLYNLSRAFMHPVEDEWYKNFEKEMGYRKKAQVSGEQAKSSESDKFSLTIVNSIHDLKSDSVNTEASPVLPKALQDTSSPQFNLRLTLGAAEISWNSSDPEASIIRIVSELAEEMRV